jgi:hypothetical protein
VSRAAALLGLALAVAAGCGERDHSAGAPTGTRRSGPARAPEAASSRILFGDLHVHTTFSIDAFVYSLPFFGGAGAHPPADACDFARHCSALDFFSINDHAESLTPDRWRETIDSIRQCNAIAGDPIDPDLVAFVGWEWTQAGPTPETHYGHRNVLLPGLGDDELPTRPITALPDGTLQRARAMGLVRAVQRPMAALGLGEYADLLWLIERMARVPDCPRGVPAPELPADCRENAETPAELFEKLAQWELETLVIPHGLAWGAHAPAGSRMDNQLAGLQHDPQRQRLLEIYSGHGNSEEFRGWLDSEAGAFCPEPTPDHLACCWRAGEIMRERCGDLPEAECEARVEEARRLALAAGGEAHRVFPDTRPEDWLDCDQCRDCFKPAFNLRSGESAQYALAVSSFEERGDDGRPRRFRYGFVASSDDHKAQPGTGFKQVGRRANTDARGVAGPLRDRLTRGWIIGDQRDPRRAQAVPDESRGFRGLLDVERVASFMYPGGLVAVHADGRDRRSIWDALLRREVYGTSGPRILLWFDLLVGPDERVPMGAAVERSEAPQFEVRALGSFVQQPGCPRDAVVGLGSERVRELCHDECYHPGDARHPIDAIEVVRIRPQRTRGEPVAALIEDPWRRFECPPDGAGCRVAFSDPDFADAGRDAAYYVRALQRPTPAINGAGVRAEFDADGNARRSRPCHASYRTPDDDDCLAPVRERAWSSPIFVDHPRAGFADGARAELTPASGSAIIGTPRTDPSRR